MNRKYIIEVQRREGLFFCLQVLDLKNVGKREVLASSLHLAWEGNLDGGNEPS